MINMPKFYTIEMIRSEEIQADTQDEAMKKFADSVADTYPTVQDFVMEQSMHVVQIREEDKNGKVVHESY